MSAPERPDTDGLHAIADAMHATFHLADVLAVRAAADYIDATPTPEALQRLAEARAAQPPLGLLDGCRCHECVLLAAVDAVLAERE